VLSAKSHEERDFVRAFCSCEFVDHFRFLALQAA
jgi:hypothetical protein